jgi:ferredoxin
MRIIAEHSVCEGLGMCEAMAHDFFEVGAAGLVNILDETPTEDNRDYISAAVDACPVAELRLQG